MLSDTIIFIEDGDNFDKFKNKISSSSLVFSLDYRTHNLLAKLKIQHELAEKYLSTEDKYLIFDFASSHHTWYENKEFLHELNFDNINLLGILDTAELHMLLIYHLQRFLILKRIIEQEKPLRLILSKNMHNSLIPLLQMYKIELDVINTDSEYSLEWDQIEFKFRIFNKAISLKISRTTYKKIKTTFENVVCSIFSLWPKQNTKFILFLEINPLSYPTLLEHLHTLKSNVLFFNRRRPAIWNMQSLRLLHKNNCKLVDLSKIEKSKSKEISLLKNHYLNKLKEIWNNDEQFSAIFNIEGFSLWPIIKQKLFDTYESRFEEYITLLIATKKTLEEHNISCILSTNVFGETEKAVLAVNNTTHSILLEHGYANYTKEIERYDVLSMYDTFRDKIAVWGEIQKKYLVEQKQIDLTRVVVVGSPRHDSFFTNKAKSKKDAKTTILLTIHSINQVSGQADTDLYIKFENLLRKICAIIKKFENVSLLVKLHPNQDAHNQDIKKLISDIDNSIQIYQLKSIKELLSISDVLVNISPEGFDPSTVLLEGLILNKPTMNIVIDNKFYDFQYEKDKAVLSISADSDLEKHLGDIISNKALQHTLIDNGKNHVNTYMTNHGTASEYLAKYLTSF